MKKFTKEALAIMASLALIAPLAGNMSNINAKSVKQPVKNSKIVKFNKTNRSKHKSNRKSAKSSNHTWHYRRSKYLKKHWYYLLGEDMAKTYSPDVTLEVLKYGKPMNKSFVRGFTSISRTHGDLSGFSRYNTKKIVKSVNAYLHGNKIFKLGWMCSNSNNMSNWYINKFSGHATKSPIIKYYFKYGNNPTFKAGWLENYKVSYDYISVHPSAWVKKAGINGAKASQANFSRNAKDVYKEELMEANANYKYNHSSKMFKLGWHDFSYYGKGSKHKMNPLHKHNKQYRTGFYARMKSLNYDA